MDEKATVEIYIVLYLFFNKHHMNLAVQIQTVLVLALLIKAKVKGWWQSCKPVKSMIGQMAKCTSQKVTAAQEWKSRLVQARRDLPTGIGQQNVLQKVCEIAPELDTLTNLTRWHNAWHGRVADVEITIAIEKAVAWFLDQVKPKRNLLKRQRLQRPQ